MDSIRNSNVKKINENAVYEYFNNTYFNSDGR